jgi:hypothetical protein
MPAPALPLKPARSWVATESDELSREYEEEAAAHPRYLGRFILQHREEDAHGVDQQDNSHETHNRTEGGCICGFRHRRRRLRYESDRQGARPPYAAGRHTCRRNAVQSRDRHGTKYEFDWSSSRGTRRRRGQRKFRQRRLMDTSLSCRCLVNYYFILTTAHALRFMGGLWEQEGATRKGKLCQWHWTRDFAEP